MIRFLAVRISLIAITLLVVSVAIFAITEALPGDAATQALGQGATEQNLAAARKRLGLDDPAAVRYFQWIWGVARGDWGASLAQNAEVWDVIRPRLGHSLVLAGFAFIVGVPAAVATGVVLGVRQNSVEDRTISVGSLVAISLPEFVTGIMLIVIFSTTLGWLPASSILLPGQEPIANPKILILPTATLMGVLFAYIMRMTRANVIDVLESNYVRTAILKGLPMWRVILRHVLPNALLPTISIIGINIGWMLGGLIIVENVFSYPGVGSLLISSIVNRDVPLLQALALLISAIYAFSNLGADLMYGVLNPRIRFT